MPAEVIGFLREDATYGEKETLKYLRANLPKEHTVYVETPVRKKRDILYPDFIVLTGYGVIVLEVKDWITVERADPDSATIRTRKNEQRIEPNPVHTARNYALALSTQLHEKLHNGGAGEAIPWSYAAVLVNLPYSVITQLRSPWGDDFVIGKDDLDNPDLLQNRLKMTFPVQRMRSLTRSELDLVRATIYPVVEIDNTNRPPFVLDTQQEKIVAEAVRVEVQPLSTRARQKAQQRSQDQLFDSLEPEDVVQVLPDGLPEAGQKLSQNTSIRLVRGFAGSGKSLVLIQRARFLVAQFPAWKIGIFTFNKQLQEQFEQVFSGSSIQPRTFHSMCLSLLGRQGDPFDIEIWLDGAKFDFAIVRQLGKPAVRQEFDWLRDMGITDLQVYLQTERRGIGRDLQLGATARSELFTAYQEYREYLAQNKRWDWPELSLMANTELQAGRLSPELYDAILIDEAQDWAPGWLQLASRLLQPETGLLFLADDPSQSIYRSFSWKEKGVSVVGRTRWLKVPYRNTFEIYQAAYCLIANHAGIQASLAEGSELVLPDISSESMRHGPRPLLQKFRSVEAELVFIREKIIALRREGYRDAQIAILVRFRSDLKPIQDFMKGYDVKIQPIHGFKGLEVEVVFIPHLQKTFQKDEPEYEAAERRILYMAMSRAREQLFLTCFGRLPRVYEDLREKSYADFVG